MGPCLSSLGGDRALDQAFGEIGVQPVRCRP